MKSQLTVLLLIVCTLVNAQNLILNPDCELPLANGKLPSWVEVLGNQWIKGFRDPAPQHGQSFFFAGDTPDAELAQTISLDDYTCSIDLGNQQFQLTAYVRSYPESLPDQSLIIVEMLNNSGTLLSSQRFGPYSTTTSWLSVSELVTAPTQTRKIKIRLQSHRRTGSTNDGYFDNLSLVPTPSGTNIKIESVSSLSANCNKSDGAFTVIVSGGSGTRQYSLDGQAFQTSPTFNNLAGGPYTITVKNGGCTLTESLTVGSISPPRIDRVEIVNASCNQADGAFTVLASGGSGIRQYSLDGQSYQLNSTFLKLGAGPYLVTVKDGDCTVSQSLTVGSANLPHIDRIDVTKASCTQADGALKVTTSGSSGTRLYSLNGQLFQAGNVFANLAGGQYTVTVKDGGCIVSQSATVGMNAPQIDGIQPTNASCNQANGVLTVTVSGANGTTQYALNEQAFQNSPTFTNLAGGTYTITVKTGGCTASQRVTVGSFSLPQIDDILPTDASCNKANGTLTVAASGGSGATQYSLDGQSFQNSPLFTGLAAGSYTVVVKDQTNCAVKGEANIVASRNCYVYAPDAFSPNSDGENDYFKFYSGQTINYTVRQFSIYNRWGEVVFFKENFSILDPDSTWWDGTLHGEKMLAGPYTYYFEYIDLKNVTNHIRGTVLLVR